MAVSLTEKATANSSVSPETLSKQELEDLSQKFGTDFLEFLNALQSEDE